MRAAVLILLLLASAAHAEPVVIPPEFRGDWCKSTWETIHRRCREHDEPDELKWQFTIDRDTVTFEEETCRPLAFRKGSGKLKGEYIVRLACQGDQPEGKTTYNLRQRWSLGANGTRLQILLANE